MPEEEFKRIKIKKASSTDVWWRDSLFFFFDLSGYILGPVLIAYIIGSLIDKKFETAPWGITIALVTGFLVSIVMLVTKTIKHMSEIEKNLENKDKK